MIRTYQFRVRELPFGIKLFARSIAEASALALQWYALSAGRECEWCQVEWTDPFSTEEGIPYGPLQQLGMAGIAVWQTESGWMIVPPDLTHIGLLHREVRKVSMFSVSASEADKGLLVLAPGPREAIELFSGHCDARGRESNGLLRVMPIAADGDADLLHDLVGLIEMGAVGVLGRMQGRVQALLPWDDAAGSF